MNVQETYSPVPAPQAMRARQGGFLGGNRFSWLWHLVFIHRSKSFNGPMTALILWRNVENAHD